MITTVTLIFEERTVDVSTVPVETVSMGLMGNTSYEGVEAIADDSEV
ncbi:hypothetical protein [Halobacillus sp. BBL2006]|nr:hypothetical protein [Halobacillus sp. BBL2006]